jgi:uncharacterized protein (DUF2062 family)
VPAEVNAEAASATFRPCVLVPVFDNRATVGDVVRGARKLGWPVIVVDDGSRDGSGEAAREAGGEVVAHSTNQGKGAALKTGFREALARGFTHAVSLDADGQLFPEDVPALLELARRSPDALVVGARELADQEHAPRKSSVGRAFSNFWVLFETGVSVADTQCGLRVYPLAHVTRLSLASDRFDFEVEVLVRAAWAGLPLLSAPVRVHYPPPAERVSHFDVLRDNARIGWLNTRLVGRRFLPWPHRKLVETPKRTIREQVAALVHESSTPPALGVAVAVGVIVGTTPFFSVQTPLAILVAAIFRLNKVATVLGSFVTTPPFTLPIAGASIELGSLLLDGRLRPWPTIEQINWSFARSIFAEWLLGGFLVGLAIGAVLGGLTALVVSRRRKFASASSALFEAQQQAVRE